MNERLTTETDRDEMIAALMERYRRGQLAEDIGGDVQDLEA
jgi:hypothetical protein